MSKQFSTYRHSISASLGKWPELSWLNRFLQTPTPADGDRTSAQVFELIGNAFVTSGIDGTAASLLQDLEVEAPGSRLRVILIGHGQSWDVDRDIVDLICSRYGLDPRFVARHFDYPRILYERNRPRDFRLALENANHGPYEDTYTWDLGGDVMSSLSIQPDSCFFFSYEDLASVFRPYGMIVVGGRRLRRPHTKN